MRMRFAALIVALLVTAGCASAREQHARPDALRQHAATAANVMSTVRGPLPARAAAAMVIGRDDATTIAALRATGTTWQGVVLLHITTYVHPYEPGRAHRMSGCFTYRYVYPRTTDSGQPHRTACPRTPALDPNRPPLPTGVTAATEATVRRAVAGLPVTQRRDPSAVTRAIAAALGRDFTVQLGHQDGGAVGFVRYGDQCLQLSVRDRVETVGPPEHGNDCFGG